MFIREVYVDSWSNNLDNGSYLDNTEWEEIKNSIINLNGRNRTQIILAYDEDIHMCIGGGNNKLYNVYITFNNESFYNLIDKSKENQKEFELITGGQPSYFPAKLCVGSSKVLIAAHSFTDNGKVEKSLDWEYES